MGLRYRVKQLEAEVEELSRDNGRLRMVTARADGGVDDLRAQLHEFSTAVWAVFRRGKAGDLEALMTKLEAL